MANKRLKPFLKRIVAVILIVCVCGCLVSCGKSDEEPEELIEGYTGKTILSFADPYGGQESEIQDLYADGNNVYCAVTDRRAAMTFCYTLSGGTVKAISSVNWTESKIGEYDRETGGNKTEVEDTDLINVRDQGFAFLPGGAFVSVGQDNANRTLTIYEKDTVSAFSMNEFGLTYYRYCFNTGKVKENEELGVKGGIFWQRQQTLLSALRTFPLTGESPLPKGAY